MRSSMRVAAAALLCGAPLAWAAPAAAGPADTVVFRGGCGVLGLGGSSAPDHSELTVAAGAEVWFENQLGRAAVLSLNGEAVVEVAAGEGATVRFHAGPVAATMELSCPLGQPTGAVRVEVVLPAQAASPSVPVAAPPPGDPPPPTASPPPVMPSPAPLPAPPPDVPGPGPGPVAPGVDPGPDLDGTTTAPADPAGAPALPRRRSPAGVPGAGGVPDSSSDQWTFSPPSRVAGATPTERVTVDGSASVVDDSGRLAAERLSATAAPATDDGPIGLLALIATVCVVGVSAGAVRAIIAQRAHRAEWA